MGVPMWVVGVILILFGSIGNNFGNNLVSLGHKETKYRTASIESRDCTELQPEKPSPYNFWVLGTVIFVMGNFLTFASFGFAAQSLLASLESVQFVSNIIFVKFVHKEAITWRMIISTISIVVGNILVVIFSVHHAKLLNSTEILYLYRTNTAYHVYLVLAFILWGSTHYVFTVYYHARTVLNKFLWMHNFWEPFTFAVSSAIIGTQAVLNSKCLSMLLQVTFRTRNEFLRPTVYVILIVWVIFVAYWLKRLDKGLELFPPLFIIPVLQVFFVFFAIICGGVFFNEFYGFTASQIAGFVFGVVMILSGVFGLAPTDSFSVKVVPAAEGQRDVEEGISGPEHGGTGTLMLHTTEEIDGREKGGVIEPSPGCKHPSGDMDDNCGQFLSFGGATMEIPSTSNAAPQASADTTPSPSAPLFEPCNSARGGLELPVPTVAIGDDVECKSVVGSE